MANKEQQNKSDFFHGTPYVQLTLNKALTFSDGLNYLENISTTFLFFASCTDSDKKLFLAQRLGSGGIALSKDIFSLLFGGN
jgi:hypothetical protein